MTKFDSRIFMESLRREAGEADQPENGTIDWSRFFSMGNETFVRTAYLHILGRPIDRIGMAEYAGRANTRWGRIHILCSLLLSPEKAGRSFWLTLLANSLRRAVRFTRH